MARQTFSAYRGYREFQTSSFRAPEPAGGKRFHVSIVPLIILVGLIVIGAAALHVSHGVKKASGPSAASAQQTSKNLPTVAGATNYCAGNSLPQLALVSVSKRHMWACEGSKSVYDSPVVTGIEYLAADITPRGTYHVYGKEKDLTLTGSDTTGSWSDPVSYWLPFLYNQYGAYGFHDATWRPNSAFGHIDPNSANASHGCVELPLASAAWLYKWAQVGTTVTVQS